MEGQTRLEDISIHAAREGGDDIAISDGITGFVFQSTPPVKAATDAVCNALRFREFQSTPPVKAATDVYTKTYTGMVISIHAAREGGDPPTTFSPSNTSISIHAAREGGDKHRHCSRDFQQISIHAAREGGDGGNV